MYISIISRSLLPFVHNTNLDFKSILFDAYFSSYHYEAFFLSNDQQIWIEKLVLLLSVLQFYI